jgi:hypothetical protein
MFLWAKWFFAQPARATFFHPPPNTRAMSIGIESASTARTEQFFFSSHSRDGATYIRSNIICIVATGHSLVDPNMMRLVGRWCINTMGFISIYMGYNVMHANQRL